MMVGTLFGVRDRDRIPRWILTRRRRAALCQFRTIIMMHGTGTVGMIFYFPVLPFRGIAIFAHTAEPGIRMSNRDDRQNIIFVDRCRMFRRMFIAEFDRCMLPLPNSIQYCSSRTSLTTNKSKITIK